jgi:GTP-binding protein YchF
MEIGIVGLPNVGKSTLFNALARAKAPASNYPYCTIDPNVAVVEVEDPRISRLGEMVQPEKLTHPLLRFVDIAGLARGASKGEGLGNMFLSHIRNVDAIVHVVRCFTDKSVVHVEGQIDPARDIEIIETELFLSDIQTLDKRIAKIEKVAKSGDSPAKKEMDVLVGVRSVLNQGKRYEIGDDLEHESESWLEQIRLVSAKPVLFVANVDEDLASETTKIYMNTLGKIADERDTVCIPISAKIEAEVTEFPPDEAVSLLKDMGLGESALRRFVRACYGLLQVVTFFTIKGEETRGWTVREGTKVRDAARRIHTDMYDRFICADVIPFEDFISCGTMAVAKEKGLIRTEGRDYKVVDGDVVLIKFGK